MQTVPSLVGTGTAVAAAAAGLVFGQPPETETPWPPSRQSIFAHDYDGFRAQPEFIRPRTSAAPSATCPSPVDDFPYSSFREIINVSPGPLTSHPTSSGGAPRPFGSVHLSSPKSNNRRHSFLRQGDVTSRPIAEDPRDSVSSRGSWVRRLSLRPLSQHGSRRSSLGPDSSSMTFSHGSGVPILGQSPTLQTAPNKLVKRTTSGQNGVAGGASRRGSKSQVLTLRRPATSHQRSATLQQFQTQGALVEPLTPTELKFSFDHQNLPSAFSPSSPRSPTIPRASQPAGKWTSFFHARRSTSTVRDASGILGEDNPYHGMFPRRRIAVGPSHVSRAYLTKPDQIAEVLLLADEDEAAQNQPTFEEKRRSSHYASEPSNSTGSTPDRRAKKSISMHFSSASQWIARTGSVRRPRRSTVDAKGGGGRYVPDLATTPQDPAQLPAGTGNGGSCIPPDGRQQATEKQGLQLEPLDRLRTCRRNSSSPLPPLNRLSSFNIDVARLGLSRPSSAAFQGPLQSPVDPVQEPQVPQNIPHSRGPSGERSVTLVGSDVEIRDGIAGEDEDTDFKSDDMYDSFRTGASSNRWRSTETPLGSMFDESPPSTASNSRSKRLSIQEMLGRPWDGETKITEEDESLHTPIRTVQLAEAPQLGRQDLKDDFRFGASQELSSVNTNLERLSFDDDDDDDWARDDENTLSNHLSPPSSTNSRRVSPTLRQALMNISGNGSHEPQRQGVDDRPRSNIFDWSEPSIHDKYDADMVRPKTVHGKQELDLRSGRSISRKPPGAAHVRSQSVPVADPSDGSKPPPKFGTWGMGTATVSEDWDDDFEFEGDGVALCLPGGKDSAMSVSVVVPASIQATQPSVKAHSGQIRELSLLVNDLKRLCRHGKDLDILNGPLAAKWAEAENIIALASPDEDEPQQSSSTKSSKDVDLSLIDDRFLEAGFDGPLLDRYFDDSLGIPKPEMSKTAVVRERHSPRRRSVFSPDDDIFGCNWPPAETSAKSAPRTPDRSSSPGRTSAVISTVIEAMRQQRAAADSAAATPARTPDTKLFFDTNSLQELVKRASHLRDALSDAVRRAELLTQSPASTPRRERHGRHNNPDGSPAFTRVFTDPASSPPRRLPNSHSGASVLSRASVESPRMQMMTVS